MTISKQMKTKNNLAFLEKELEHLQSAGVINKISTLSSPVGARVEMDGRTLINLCSNDYLGLGNNDQLKKAAISAIKKYGINTGAVRSISGNHELHNKLEKALAKFKKTQDCIVVQGGFVANLAVIPTITGEEDIIFSDELNHASIIDGCRLSKSRVVRFAHGDAADLEKQIKSEKSKFRRGLIVTDGVFSMDGDVAALPDLVAVKNKYGLMLMVDDAHGEGVLGNHGRGIVDHYNLHGQVEIEVGTLSKAFGAVGGFVAGEKVLIDYLRQRARPFLFSTGLTIADTAAALAAVGILSKSDTKVKKLWKNTDYLKSNLKKLGFDVGNSQTPIIPVILGEVEIAKKFSDFLKNEGILAKAIGYPTVPRGTARIRVMNSSSHDKRELDLALGAFEKAGRKFKLIK